MAFMLAMMAGGAVLGGLSSAQGAKLKAMQGLAKYRHDEANRTQQWADQSWFQVLSNAERFVRNKTIAKEALSVREKSKFWDRVRYENATGKLSKGMRQAYSNLGSELSGRMGSNSATTRAILRNGMQNYYSARENMNVNEALRGRGREEVYQRTLGTRDFGFTPISEHNKGSYVGVDPQSAYNLALISGLAGGASSVGGAAYQGNPGGWGGGGG
jgi:hypothetical protein